MTYAALPDRRMPYDNDGTIIYQGTLSVGADTLASGANAISWQAIAYSTGVGRWVTSSPALCTWMFFPETREVTASYIRYNVQTGPGGGVALATVQGSNDSGNGLDGSWETATLSGGVPTFTNFFSWRPEFKPISFTGGKKTIRFISTDSANEFLTIAHIYGQKAAGQTPEDIIYLNGATAYTEYTAPEDFGDQPLATSVTHTFKVKNTSATKTANTINVQCNDSDFIISTDNATWVVTINIGSLAAGASSAVMYVRCTTPAIGSILGPRFARIVTTVASYT